MQLEDYFEFEKYNEEEVGEFTKIRLKGSRILLENIVEMYLKGDSPERIFQAYRSSLILEQVYAAITYFLHNRKEIEEYIRRGNEVADFWYQKHLAKGPDPVTEKVRQFIAQRQAAKME